MSNRLISVIIPIYKVEEYLDQCVESVVRQSYTNLEIILVDDGSPDGCPNICDRWAERDERVKVVHKPNGGLSSARNAGLDIATGDFISFVDSDDFMPLDAYDKMLHVFSQYPEAAYVNGRIVAVDGDRQSSYRKTWEFDSTVLIESQSFFERIIKMEISHPVWCKLYRTDVIRGLRFPVGRNNEDMHFMFQLSHIIEEKHLYVVDIPDVVYYYRNREGSICNNVKTPLDIDVLKNYQDFREYYAEHKDPRVSLVEDVYINRLVTFCMKMLFNDTWKGQYFDKYYKEFKSVDNRALKSAFRTNNKMYLHSLAFKYMPTLYIPIKRKIGF